MRTLLYHVRKSNERNTLAELCDGCRSLSSDLRDVRGEYLCPDCRPLDRAEDIAEQLDLIAQLSEMVG